MSFTRSMRYERRCLDRTRAYFLELRGAHDAARRAAEIEALPIAEWKGHRLRTLRCLGPFGRGPHLVHVPDYVCWSLISLENFTCPYHR
jgi:hypothetical protein